MISVVDEIYDDQHDPPLQVLQDLDARSAQEKADSLDERKRTYNSMAADTGAMPTEEEMEAYKLRKHMRADPMSQFAKDKWAGSGCCWIDKPNKR